MHLDTPEAPPDSHTQRRADRGRLLRALNASLGFVLLLGAVYAAQVALPLDWRWLAVEPMAPLGLLGVLTAPLLHGSIGHLAANAASLLLLGTLAGAVYPRATLRALPMMWLGSGLGAWLLGMPGSHHLGASGLTHGLFFLVFVIGLLRRDRPAIAAAMIAFLLYGGMLLTILPRELDVSWQSHLGGALGGVVAAVLWRRTDPSAPRRRYSWEMEDGDALPLDGHTLEPPRPTDVPVLWHRDGQPSHVALPADDGDIPRGQVLPFPPRRE